MDGVICQGVTDELLMVASRALTGRERRVFQGRVCTVGSNCIQRATRQPIANPVDWSETDRCNLSDSASNARIADLDQSMHATKRVPSELS